MGLKDVRLRVKLKKPQPYEEALRYAINRRWKINKFKKASMLEEQKLFVHEKWPVNTTQSQQGPKTMYQSTQGGDALHKQTVT